MCRSLFLSAVLAATSMLASAAELWAPGVSRNSGWVDYDKERVERYDENGNEYAWNDTGMCWAASASNVLKWWQTQNADSLTSTKVPQDPWTVFRGVFLNGGSSNAQTPTYALEWYIDGKKNNYGDYTTPLHYDEYGFVNTVEPEGSKEEPRSDWPYGHFINTGNGDGTVNVVYNTAENPIFLFDNYANKEGGGRAMTLAILDAMEKGYALCLSLFNQAGNAGLAHAITLWGVEYDGEGDNRAITAMWITDSDNADDDGLQRYTLYDLNGVDEYGNPMKQNTLAFSSGAFEGATIGYVAGMRSDLVPEPTTATLSLLALAGLAVRRRRK